MFEGRCTMFSAPPSTCAIMEEAIRIRIELLGTFYDDGDEW